MLSHDAPFMPPGIGRGRRAVTSTATVTGADQGLCIDSTSGTFATNLPAVATAGSGFHVAIYNSGAGVNTVTASGAETIRTPSGTATTFALSRGQGAVLSCTGAAWEVISSVGLIGGSSSVTTDNAIARFDGAAGALQNSGVIIDDSNNITGVVALTMTNALTMAGNITHTNTTQSNFLAGTSDGSDTSATAIAGGGGAGDSRGASIVCFGNEHATAPGELRMLAGDAAGDGIINIGTAGSFWITVSRTGVLASASTIDATASGTAANTLTGGLSVAKAIISAKGHGFGVTSTATAGATTTLVQGSTFVQIFTGTLAQSVTLPAANLWGAGIAVTYIIKNRSTGAITINRAGSDTIDGATSLVLGGSTNASAMLMSDGVSEWEVV